MAGTRFVMCVRITSGQPVIINVADVTDPKCVNCQTWYLNPAKQHTAAHFMYHPSEHRPVDSVPRRSRSRSLSGRKRRWRMKHSPRSEVCTDCVFVLSLLAVSDCVLRPWHSSWCAAATLKFPLSLLDRVNTLKPGSGALRATLRLSAQTRCSAAPGLRPSSETFTLLPCAHTDNRDSDTNILTG